SVYLYVSRELFLFAALFVGYLVMIVIGYRVWVRQWRSERIGGEVPSGAHRAGARAGAARPARRAARRRARRPAPRGPRRSAAGPRPRRAESARRHGTSRPGR